MHFYCTEFAVFFQCRWFFVLRAGSTLIFSPRILLSWMDSSVRTQKCKRINWKNGIEKLQQQKNIAHISNLVLTYCVMCVIYENFFGNSSAFIQAVIVKAVLFWQEIPMNIIDLFGYLTNRTDLMSQFTFFFLWFLFVSLFLRSSHFLCVNSVTLDLFDFIHWLADCQKSPTFFALQRGPLCTGSLMWPIVFSICVFLILCFGFKCDQVQIICAFARHWGEFREECLQKKTAKRKALENRKEHRASRVERQKEAKSA